jgi:nitrate/nitrite transporter NarK
MTPGLLISTASGTSPIGGVLSDRIGIKNNMLLFTGLATLLTTPLLTVLRVRPETL